MNGATPSDRTDPVGNALRRDNGKMVFCCSNGRRSDRQANDATKAVEKAHLQTMPLPAHPTAPVKTPRVILPKPIETLFFLCHNRRMPQSNTHVRSSEDFHSALDAALKTGTCQSIQRALWLSQHDQRLRAQLTMPLANHCQLANIRDDQLIFLVDSPLWHSKLRLQHDALLLSARQLGLAVSRLTIKTATRPLMHGSVNSANKRSCTQHALPPGLRVALEQLKDC